MHDHILVTGATGLIGQELVKQLAKKHTNLSALVRKTSQVEQLKHLGIRMVYADLNDENSLKAALNGIDKVFYLPPFAPNMVELSNRLINAAKANDVKHIVKISSVRVNLQTDEFTIGNWHREIESKIEQSRISYTFLRSYTFMQTLVKNNAQMIKHDRALYLPMGDGREPFVDVRDIAEVACHVLTESGHKNKKYSLSGPEVLTYDDIAKELSAVLQREIKYVDIPMEEAQQLMLKAGMPTVICKALIENYEVIKHQKYGYQPLISPIVEQITGRTAISFKNFAEDYKYDLR